MELEEKVSSVRSFLLQKKHPFGCLSLVGRIVDRSCASRFGHLFCNFSYSRLSLYEEKNKTAPLALKNAIKGIFYPRAPTVLGVQSVDQ